jgi:hypothetical protein
MRAQKSTSPDASAPDEDETLQRQHAALKRAYSKLQIAHWEKEQAIEQRDGEIVRLKAALDAAKGNAGVVPAATRDRGDAGSSSLLLVTEGDAAPAHALAGLSRAQAPVLTPVPTPPASDASEAASPPQAPEKKKPGRGAGRKRVRPGTAPRQADKGHSAPDQEEAAKFCNEFFKRFGVNSHHTLHEKLAEFLIARDPNVNTDEKRRTAISQTKYKASRFMELLWLDPPGAPKPYRPGNVDDLFHFFIQKTDHDDMGRPESHTYANHVHRVAHWFSPHIVEDYAAFKHEDNKYEVRRARGSLTGVRAVHGLYEIWKGKAEWPDAERNPIGLVTPRSKAPVKRGPCAKRPAAPRKATQAYNDDDKKGNASDDAANVASSEDDSSEGDWSCADDSDDSGDCGGSGSTSRARKARKNTCDSERELAHLFESIGQGGV